MVDLIVLIPVVVALLMLYRTYDEIIQRFIYHIYEPEVAINIKASVSEGGSSEEYTTGFMGGFSAGRYNIEQLDPEEAEGMLLLPVTVHNLEEKDIRIRLEIISEPFMAIWFEETRREGDYLDFQTYDESPKRRIEFAERLVRSPYGDYPTFYLALPIHPENTYGAIPIDARINVTIDAPQFKIPVLNLPLPQSVGEIQFAPVEQHFEVLGPALEGIEEFMVVTQEDLDSHK